MLKYNGFIIGKMKLPYNLYQVILGILILN